MDAAKFAAKPRVKNINAEQFTRAQRNLPEVLRKMGWKALRQGQDRAVANTLIGRDTLVVLPTGQGKSACYIVPTLCANWKTIVFSPLVALMQDQVENLWRAGCRAGQISSAQTGGENQMMLNQWASGDLDFLLVAPERLENEEFCKVLGAHRPNMVTIDEAHTASAWADNFRPSYMKIGTFIENVRPDVVLCLTATATKEVEADIRRIFGLPEADKVVYYPARENLKLFSRAYYDDSQIVDALNRIAGSKIVYCATRARCEQLIDTVGRRLDGGSAVYHGGMDADQRTTRQQMFMRNEVEVIFATNAFGLGVNKPDIRAVIHRDCPGSIEALSQEQGRAGRDGLDSECILFVSDDAFRTQEFFIKSSYPSRNIIERVFFNLQKKKDATGFLQLTVKQIAESAGVREMEAGAAISILESSRVIARESADKKTASVRILEEHMDDNLKQVIDGIRSVGKEDDGLIRFDLEFLSNRLNWKEKKVKDTLRLLDENNYISYTGPFRGKGTKILDDNLDRIDFKAFDEKRTLAFERLNKVREYVDVPNERKHDFLLNYFGFTT